MGGGGSRGQIGTHPGVLERRFQRLLLRRARVRVVVVARPVTVRRVVVLVSTLLDHRRGAWAGLAVIVALIKRGMER